LILQKTEDPSLHWFADGHVRVLTGKVLPPTRFKQTEESQRMRFQKAIEKNLMAEGWIKNE